MGCSNSKGVHSLAGDSTTSQVVEEEQNGKPLELSPFAAKDAAPMCKGTGYTAAQPVNESERLATLCALAILDTEQDQRFDEITRLMRKLFKVEISCVSIIDEFRVWLKSKDNLGVENIPRDIAICAWTLVPPHPELLVLEDTMKDTRFFDCPLVVQPPYVRFYCGAPLIASNGHRLGNLVIMDTKPGKLDAERAMLLANFAEIVVRQIEKTAMANTQTYLMHKNAKSLLRALDCFSEGLMLCNMKSSGWDLLYINDSWTSMMGTTTEAAINTELWSHCQIVGNSQEQLDKAAKAVEKGAEFSVFLTARGRRFSATFRSAHLGQFNETMPLLSIPARFQWDPSQSKTQPFYFGTMRPATDTDGAVTLSLHSTMASSLPKPGEDQFRDVVLGPILGRGSYGKVYRGMWQGTAVAVKIMQYTLGESNAAATCKSLAEIAGTRVVHPNICTCYSSSSRIVSENTTAPVDPVRDEDMTWRAVADQTRPACISDASLPSDMDSAAGGGQLGVPQKGDQSSTQVLNHNGQVQSGLRADSVADSVAEGAAKHIRAGHVKSAQSALLLKHAVLNDLKQLESFATNHAGHQTHGRDTKSWSTHSVAADSHDENSRRDSYCSVRSELSQHSPSEAQQPQEQPTGNTTACLLAASQGDDRKAGQTPPAAASSGSNEVQNGAQDGAHEGPPVENKCVVQETWMLMELCDMGTLLDACQRGKFTRIADDNQSLVPNMLAICQTLQEICSALDYMHNLDILHADLNGNNVLLVSCKHDARGFTAKVSDFGLSRLVSDVVNTASKGTTTHMPPEMLADGDLSKGTDVYGVGVIMWEMYHGKRAYAGMHPMQVMYQVAVQKLPLDFPADRDRHYVALAKQCLLPDRHQRPTTAELLSRVATLIQACA